MKCSSKEDGCNYGVRESTLEDISLEEFLGPAVRGGKWFWERAPEKMPTRFKKDEAESHAKKAWWWGKEYAKDKAAESEQAAKKKAEKAKQKAEKAKDEAKGTLEQAKVCFFVHCFCRFSYFKLKMTLIKALMAPYQSSLYRKKSKKNMTL